MTSYQAEAKNKNWWKIYFVVRNIICGFQGSILCPLFFSIFLVDLFSVIEAIRYKIEDITSYADNTTPFIVEENIENIIVS